MGIGKGAESPAEADENGGNEQNTGWYGGMI